MKESKNTSSSLLKTVLGTIALTGFLVGCSAIPTPDYSQKEVGETYRVSVQSMPTYSDASADSAIVSEMKLGDRFHADQVLFPGPAHLKEDKADSWVAGRVAGKKVFVPASALVSEALWSAQEKGLPPKGEAKVKRFTLPEDQESDADSFLADSYRPGNLYLLMGASGRAKTRAKVSHPEALMDYFKQENPDFKPIDFEKTPSKEGGFAQMPSTNAFFEVGPYQEYDLGAGLVAFLMPKVLSPNHQATIYVRNVLDRLVRNSSVPAPYSGWHVLVLADNEVNAYAAPGGFVVVTVGMLKFLQSEDELAAILAHEIGHVEFHHSAREMGPQNFAAFSFAALDAAVDLADPLIRAEIIKKAETAAKKVPFFDKLPAAEQTAKINAATDLALKKAQEAKSEALKKMGELAMSITCSLTSGHEEEFEKAADRRAATLTIAAGYNPDAMNNVLARLKQKQNGFGEAYPENRDVLYSEFSGAYEKSVSAKNSRSPVGNYLEMRASVTPKYLSRKQLFMCEQKQEAK